MSEEWATIRAARAAQNLPDAAPVPNPWDRKCRCGHPMRDHRMDYDDEMDGLAPDCGNSIEVTDPDTLVVSVGPCPCVEFRLRR